MSLHVLYYRQFKENFTQERVTNFDNLIYEALKANRRKTFIVKALEKQCASRREENISGRSFLKFVCSAFDVCTGYINKCLVY